MPTGAWPAGASATRPYGSTTFRQVIDLWLELSCALNQVNRSMGHKDLYPFVLSPTVVRKLAFVDRLVSGIDQAGGELGVGSWTGSPIASLS